MSKIDIDTLIIKSFQDVKKYDSDLPEDIHERTFVFRMGHYLANYIEENSEYKVDFEYNRVFNHIKELDKKRIIPDLIIHKRSQRENKAIVEFKKDNDDADDKKRLIKMKNEEEYLYQNIYFVSINDNKVEKYIDNTWVKINGEINE